MAEQSAVQYTEHDDTRMTDEAFQDLLSTFPNPLDPKDKEQLTTAFKLGRKAHHGQRRKSGETYFLHPIAVAKICVEEIGLGPTAVICALLHDVVEDTPVTLKDISEVFGDRVTLIIDGLTKLDGLHKSENYQAENMQKVLKGMLTDVRVALIKMADRLHNLRTIGSMPEHKKQRIAAETDYVYTPLSHRLGLYNIKTEFQDICLRITHPDDYREIADKLANTLEARNEYIEKFKAPLIKALDSEMDISYRIMSRPKSIFSIWNKIQKKDVTFEGIYDLFAMRIIIDTEGAKEKTRCWEVYSIVSDLYRPITHRLRDWVTAPKANGYESLHTTVLGPDGSFVEVQIRTKRMDAIAERGFAAHWKYKGVKGGDVYDKWLAQVRETLESHVSGDAGELMENMQDHLFGEEVHVFTPLGALKILPEGATALDFAFSIHSDVGATCVAVKINNRLVPISYKLRHGDQIEILTKTSQKPSKDWLKIVVTSKAKYRIRTALREEKRMKASYGAESLTRKLNNLKADFETNVEMLAKHYGYPNRLEFLAAIHHDQVDLSTLKQFKNEGQKLVWVVEKKEPTEEAPTVEEVPEKSKDGLSEVLINGEAGSLYKNSFAACCNPVYGDPIFGFITTKDGVKLHRTTCPNAGHLRASYGYRCIEAGWGKTVRSSFVTEMHIKGVDTGVGVIQKITGIISTGFGINIRNFNIAETDGYFEGSVSLLVINRDQLNLVIKSLKEIDGVHSVTRTS